MTGTSFIPVFVVIIIVVKTRRFIDRFIYTQTTSPQSAKSLDELGLPRRMIFNRLLRQKVLVESGLNRYYLDAANLAKFFKTRRIIMSLVFGMVLFLIFIDWFFIHY